MIKNTICVLLIEDDPGDVELTKESLSTNKIKINLKVLKDGVEALKYLHQSDRHNLPDLIFLDLNLPRKDGREVLKEIKSNDKLKAIPVVVLTTSEADEDILKSYNLGANCYVTKPVGIEQFSKIIQTNHDFF